MEILEKIAKFYAELCCNKWDSFINIKPDGFDNMPYNKRCEYIHKIRKQVDEIMSDPWNIIKLWQLYIKLFDNDSDKFFKELLDHYIDNNCRHVRLCNLKQAFHKTLYKRKV